jgi:transcriptional regulator with XRE-family HTH domain
MATKRRITRRTPKAAMSAADFKRIREALGLTQNELAERTGLHPITVAKYEIPGAGGYPVLKVVAELMKCLYRSERKSRASK